MLVVLKMAPSSTMDRWVGVPPRYIVPGGAPGLPSSPKLGCVGVISMCTGLCGMYPMYDAMGSIAVGGMLGSVALFIVERNRRFLTQVAPARTPPEIVQKLSEACAAALRDEELAAKLRGLGATPTATTPDAFRAFVTDRLADITRLVEVSGLRFN